MLTMIGVLQPMQKQLVQQPIMQCILNEANTGKIFLIIVQVL